jgi:hypothetical protein
VGATGYEVRPETWVRSGRGVIDASDALAAAVNELCSRLGAAGDCWGSDEIGRAFFNGDEQTPGFGVSRDALLADLADMVNLVRATGGLLIVSGHTYAVADEASTVGSALPPGADKGALAASDPYALPSVTWGFVRSDPPPEGLEAMWRFMGTLVGGCEYPDGNVDALAGMSRAWQRAAYAIRQVAEEVRAHANAVTANNAGQATSDFAGFAAALHGGGDEGGLLWLADACEGMAGSVDFLMTQKTATRTQFNLSLEFLLATWALAWVISAVTGGASVEAATATTIARGVALRTLVRTVATTVAKGGLAGAWFGGGMDAIGQYSRIRYGLQDHFDSTEFGKAAAEGAVAGAVMGGAGLWVARKGNRLTTALAQWMQTPGLRGLPKRFMVAGSLGTVGNVAGQAFVEGHIDLAHAAQFGFGMAGIDIAKDAGKHTAANLANAGGTRTTSDNATGNGSSAPGARGDGSTGTGTSRRSATRTGGNGGGGDGGTTTGRTSDGTGHESSGGTTTGKTGEGTGTGAGTRTTTTGDGRTATDGTTHVAGDGNSTTGDSDAGAGTSGDGGSGGRQTETGPAFSKDGTFANPRQYPHYSANDVGFDLELSPSEYHWNEPAQTNTAQGGPATGHADPTTGNTDPAGRTGTDPRQQIPGSGDGGQPGRLPPARLATDDSPTGATREGSPVLPQPPTEQKPVVAVPDAPPSSLPPTGEVPPSRQVGPAIGEGRATRPATTATRPDVGIAELLNAPPRSGPLVPLGQGTDVGRTASGGGGEVAPVSPVVPEIHPPRYVEMGALGETAVHSVQLPADPQEAARVWVEGLPSDISPKMAAEIQDWLAERLADTDREGWTDLLQKGVAFAGKKTVVYLKPDLRDLAVVQGPEGPRHYPVSFGGDGAEARELGVADAEVVGGAITIVDNSDAYEELGLPGMSMKTSTRVTEATGLDVMSGRKTVAAKHDFFTAHVAFKVYRNGAEVPYDAVVPDLSMVVPFPEEYHRVGPLTTGDGPPLVPRYEVPADAARRMTDHGIIVTAIDTTPIALEIQRRALEAGVRPQRIVTMIDDLLSSVLSEQGMKNRGQWWLTSGSATEPVRSGSSRFHATEDSFRVTSTFQRMEPIHESTPAGIETRVRDDLGIHNTTTETNQSAKQLEAWFGLKLKVGNGDEFFARAGANVKVGRIHMVTTSYVDLPKTTLIRTLEVARYDTLVRLHVATEKMGSFDVDVRAEMAIPVDHAQRFESDIFGRELDQPRSSAPQIEQSQSHPEQPSHPDQQSQQSHPDQTAARPHHQVAVPDPQHVQPHGADVPYEPHPKEPALLAAGRGPGLGTVARLPQSERLVTGIHDAVTKALPDLPDKEMRQIRRAIDANFGRPALEADLANLLNGIDHRTTVGKYHIEISAHGRLGERHGVDEYDLTVNERRLTGSAVSTGRTLAAGGGAEVAANLRIKAGRIFGIDFPKASISGGGGGTKRTVFASGYTMYYRTETDGPVIAFQRALPIDVKVKITKSGKELAHESWQITEARAEVAVPNQHVPPQALTAADIAGVGRIEVLDRPPQDVLTLRGRVAGMIRIGAMPDLALEVARADALGTAQPPPQSRAEVSDDILNITRPSFLEANLPKLTSKTGMTIEIADQAGWQRAVHLKIGVAGLEHTRSGPGVEYEQYTNANSRVLTGQGRTYGGEAQGQAGVRVGLGETGHDSPAHKAVANVGASFSAKRGTGSSSYDGGMDVTRGTYDGEAHWYHGDIVVEVTPVRWKGHTVIEGPTTHIRVNEIMDLVAPDQVARHLGLEGPSPDAPLVTDHRTYISSDLALTSGFVENLSAESVLPQIVDIFHEQKLLFPGEEHTTSPTMKILRARYGEESLWANLSSARDGLTTWIPIDHPVGFTDYVGVRVKAVIADGAHTAERPDVRLMLRSEHITGNGRITEAGAGGGGRALARYTHYTDTKAAGIEAVAGRISERGTSDARNVGVKDIDRIQTFDRSHEFTHPVRYEIEVVHSHEPPPGLEQLARGGRGALRKFGELTGHDAAGRFWDRHRDLSSASRTADGELRLLVPEHLTAPASGRHAAVPVDVPVAGEAPRWSKPVGPLSVNETLREFASQVAVPAAPLIGQWAPVAGLSPKLRGPVPLLSDRPPGYELSVPIGMKVAEASNPRTVRANLKALLAHEYAVPVLGGREVQVGINVHRATEVSEAEVKQRLYTQTMTTASHGRSHATDRTVRGGLSAGPAGGDQGTGGAGRGRGTGEELASRAMNIRERNREATTGNKYYRCAISLVFHGRDGDLVMDVSDGLYLRLSEAGAEALQQRHGGFIL